MSCRHRRSFPMTIPHHQSPHHCHQLWWDRYGVLIYLGVGSGQVCRTLSCSIHPPPPPPPRMVMPPLPPSPPPQPRMTQNEAYTLAVDQLKYRCTRCINPRFLSCGKCPFQWKGNTFLNRCRFYHNEEERQGMPSKTAVDKLVSVLMWGK